METNTTTPTSRTFAPQTEHAIVPSAPTAAGGLSPPLAAGLASVALIWPALAGLRWGPQRPLSGLWYAMLRKPGFKPPDAAIPLAWTAIDAALAAGAYRLLRRPASARRNHALLWLTLNVGLIGGWSAVFFGRRNLPASTVLAATMVGTGAAFVASAREVDAGSAAAGVPFVAWLAFATVLTATLWRRNR